jgi:thiol-disulfide isomerase/thioredoxin
MCVVRRHPRWLPSLLLLVCFWLDTPTVTAFSALHTKRTPRITAAFANSKATETESNKPAAKGKVVKQTAVLDGGEWFSVRNRLLQQQNRQKDTPPPSYARTVLGVLTAVTGSIDGKRVVGMQVMNPADNTEAVVTLDQDSSVQLYKESVAHIPDRVTEQDAVWTLLQSLSIIHCARPVLRNVGGSLADEFLQNGKVVVLGGNDLAVTAALALQKLDCQVTVVAAEKPSGLPASIRHLPPAVGEENLGFSSVIEQFDSVLDTLGDEQDDLPGGSTVTKQLAEIHGCHTYVSAQTESQELIVRNGLIWGPAKSKEHIAKQQSRAAKATAAQFPSPTSFGATIRSLLENGVVLAAPKQKLDPVFVRGWSLKDFWEYTKWPRYSASNMRFGFPGTDEIGDEDEEDDEGPMISAPPLNPNDLRPEMFESPEEDVENQYVVGVNGVKGLQRIVQDETTCLLFLSAPFCRTCRYLKPRYQRMARTYTDTASDKGEELGFVFVKAEAAGLAGKELGRALGIDAVPSFVFFKKGRRYGKPLSISRLPSKKLELAIEYLQQDKPWNDDLLSDKEEGLEGGSGRGSSNRSKLL